MSQKTLFHRSLHGSRPVWAAMILGLGLSAACGDQKDPNDSLGGGDETSDETTTTKPTETTSDKSDSETPTSGDPTSSDTSGNGGTDTESQPTSSDESSGTDETSTSPTTDGETSAPPMDSTLCPMVEGATWSYFHSSGWTETQTVALGEYDGKSVFIVSDTPNPSDDLRSDSYHVKVDGAVERVYKEQFWVDPNTQEDVIDTMTTYDPGFLRCNEAWADKEAGWAESPEYTRIETPAGQAAKAPEARKHTFTVEGREDVSTASGLEFTNCVKVRRGKDWAATDGEDVEEKLYWFCPGVGKVREENVVKGSYEELTEYSIPN